MNKKYIILQEGTSTETLILIDSIETAMLSSDYCNDAKIVIRNKYHNNDTELIYNSEEEQMNDYNKIKEALGLI